MKKVVIRTLRIEDYSFFEKACPGMSEILTDKEKARFYGYLKREDGVNFVMGRWLVRDGLDLPLQDFKVGEFGKPLAPPPNAFSISHAHGMVAVAYSSDLVEVGLDVEAEASPFADLDLGLWLSEAERSPGNLNSRDLARVWTSKEAYLKATGRGISDELATFDAESVMKRHASTYFAESGFHFACVVLEDPGTVVFVREQMDVGDVVIKIGRSPLTGSFPFV